MTHHARRGYAPTPEPNRRVRLSTIVTALLLTFGLLATASTPVAQALSILPDSKPKASLVKEKRSVNLGVKFSTSQDGSITALQFYRSSKQKKAYTGSLWSSKGKLLARVTFPKSSKQGWQTARLSKPVAVKKGTTYVASYLASDGQFAVVRGGFAKKRAKNGITVPKNGGVFKYNSKSKRPTSSGKGSNYLVDVVYQPAGKPSTSPTPKPTPSATPTPKPTPSTSSTPKPTPTPTPTTTAPAGDLSSVLRSRVLVAHQSVGQYILQQVPAVFAAAKLPAPTMLTADQAVGRTTPVIANTGIGQNGDPLGKLAAFKKLMNSAAGANYDVALVKLCYVDFTASTKPDELFADYVKTMDAIAKAHPDVALIYTTAPVLTEDNPSAVAATTVGGLTAPWTGSSNPNHARERYNALIRQKYAGTGRLFDIAAIEARTATGMVTTRTWNGRRYYVMNPANTFDGGHPNEASSLVLARELLNLVRNAVDR